MNTDNLDSEFLFRLLFSWFAQEKNWALRDSLTPYSGSRTSVVAQSGQSVAKKAAASKHLGELLLLACDVMNLPLNELARVSGVKITRISEVVQGQTPTSDESVNLKSAMVKFANERGLIHL